MRLKSPSFCLFTRIGCSQAAQLRRHDLELIGARAQDEIFRHQNPSLPRPTLRLTCRHTDIFRTAILFDSLVQSLVRQYSCEEAHQATETEAEAKAETETESELKPFMEGGAGAPLRAEICNSGRNPTDI